MSAPHDDWYDNYREEVRSQDRRREEERERYVGDEAYEAWWRGENPDDAADDAREKWDRGEVYP